jgi:hypothetical protein
MILSTLISTQSKQSSIKFLLLLDEVLDELRSQTLWPLKRQAKGAVPVKLTQSPDGTTHSKYDGVVLELGESIVPQKDSTVGIDVGVSVGVQEKRRGLE